MVGGLEIYALKGTGHHVARSSEGWRKGCCGASGSSRAYVCHSETRRRPAVLLTTHRSPLRNRGACGLDAMRQLKLRPLAWLPCIEFNLLYNPFTLHVLSSSIASIYVAMLHATIRCSLILSLMLHTLGLNLVDGAVGVDIYREVADDILMRGIRNEQKSSRHHFISYEKSTECLVNRTLSQYQPPKLVRHNYQHRF